MDYDPAVADEMARKGVYLSPTISPSRVGNTAADAHLTEVRRRTLAMRPKIREAQRDMLARGVKIIGLSVDPVENHEKWAGDIAETQGAAPNYPLIGDADFTVSQLYGMLPADTSGDPTQRTPAQNQTVRNVFVVGPDKRIKLILVYPMTTGRNFDEVLRVIDSLQLTARHRVATPANWRQGDDVIIAGSVSDDEARTIWPHGWAAPRPYIRIVPQP